MLLNMESVKKFIEDASAFVSAGNTEQEIAEALDIPWNLRGRPSVLYLRQFLSTAKSYVKGRITPDILRIAKEYSDTIVQAIKDRTVARHFGGKNSMLRRAALVAWFADYLNSHYNN